MENSASNQKIFVSYSRKDGQDYAFRVAGDLRAAGANVWMDQIDIEPGKPWDLEVENALKSADCVLFIATEKSVGSGNVLNEVYYALDENKRILPAVFHDCPFPFQLRRLQRIDFSNDYDAGFRRLQKALGMNATVASATHQEATSPVAAVKTETKAEPVNVLPATPTVDRIAVDDGGKNTPSSVATAFGEENKRSPKKMVLWVLGAAALALIGFLLIRNVSGSDSNTANTSDTTRILSKTGEAKPADSPALNTQPSGQVKTAETTKVKPDDNNSSVATNNAAEKQKQFERYKQAGMNHFNAKAYKDAIVSFGDALKIQNDAEVDFYTGRSYGQLQEYPTAIDYYSKAIALAPGKASYWGSRGLAHRNNKQYAESVADFDKAISLDPSDGQLYHNRGLTKQLNNDPTGACTDFQAAAKLNNAAGQKAYDSYCGQSKPSVNPQLRLNRAKLQTVRKIQPANEKY